MILFRTASGLSWINPATVQAVEVESEWSVVTTAQKTLTVSTADNLEALAELVQRHDLNELVESCETAWALPF
jgi:hypothetical protein